MLAPAIRGQGREGECVRAWGWCEGAVRHLSKKRELTAVEEEPEAPREIFAMALVAFSGM